MKKLISLVLLVASVSGSTAALAENQRANIPTVRFKDIGPDESILKDVYVQLYLTRMQRAKLEIERSKQLLSVSLRQRDRIEKLFQKSASTGQDLEEARRDAEVSAIAVQAAESAAAEAEIFVDIAISRISLGFEMPICAEIR